LAEEAAIDREVRKLTEAGRSTSAYGDARLAEVWTRWVGLRRAALNRDLALVRARRESVGADYARATARAEVLKEMRARSERDARYEADKRAVESRLQAVLVSRLIEGGRRS
jgi:MoxR-like ATPase